MQNVQLLTGDETDGVTTWLWILEQQSWFFGCCAADLQAEEDQNQLNNNLKIDFGAPKSGDRSQL